MTQTFESFGQFFTLNGQGLFVGQAVASFDAIYLVTGSAPWNLLTLFTGRLGTPNQDHDLFPVALSDIPETILGDPSWPIPRCNAHLRAFHRSDHPLIHGSLLGHVTIACNGSTAKIRSPTLSVRKMMKILSHYDWSF